MTAIPGIVGGPPLLLHAHPGHELRLFGWMEQNHPTLFLMTDGSGGGASRTHHSLETALRAGAKSAVCLYRRDFANMPGSRKEYYNALEEGADFQFLTNPTEILADETGAVRAVRCVRMELGAPDASGRCKPRAVPDSEFDAPIDLVLVAYGFDPVSFPEDSEFSAIKVTEWGGIVVDRNQMTSLPGVFAGGDSVRGPSLVVHAVRDARKAAKFKPAAQRLEMLVAEHYGDSMAALPLEAAVLSLS